MENWPVAAELAAADTVLFYCDGAGEHTMLRDDRLAQLGKEMDRGAGLVCLHFAVEFPADRRGHGQLS